MNATDQMPLSPTRIREPAVAGLFYPRDPGELARTIDSLLADAAPTKLPGELRALICPHAGYAYSGPVAATAYRLLQGRSFESVLVLAPSHYAGLANASVSGAAFFRTPLGDVPLSPKARRLAHLPPFALDAHADVERPGWWRQSSRPAPDHGDEDADTWEHADEVQVPFLQKTLASFQLIPVVFGRADPVKAAAALAQILDVRTLIVVSSDLSHYHPYAEAGALDRRCTDAICRLDTEAASKQEACGRTPILALLHLARQQGWQARLLDYRNSGDTAGNKSHVVGYAAIAFYSPPASAPFTAAERRTLLELARRTVRAVVTTGRPPELPSAGISPRLTAPRGCFVTLTRAGRLRGCIGTVAAQEPLYRAVLENARSAALHDSRFLPVAERELDQLGIEISVLTPPVPLAFASPADLLAKLQPHRDGVVLRIGQHGATYLPQVWEQLPDKEAFLNSLSKKAGCAPSAWRGPDVRILTYRAEAFNDTERGT
ncbi:MAG: AmmeMemoRadiSam system protein B [Opitutaceae bacterium]|nr:AmmeMemoRadiSam system protein B [Opitutaceae bacterium]